MNLLAISALPNASGTNTSTSTAIARDSPAPISAAINCSAAASGQAIIAGMRCKTIWRGSFTFPSIYDVEKSLVAIVVMLTQPTLTRVGGLPLAQSP